jgi:hypothetical protein
VSFLPYISDREVNGFWNYNKTLFVRFLASVLYSGVIYIGLVLALLSLNTLFNIDIEERLYFEMFIVVGGFFNTWFFVAGIPKQLEQLESVKVYPNSLKVFSQFVLLPLLGLYLFILYVYGTKILLQWDWPKGVVSYLISGVSVLGIFTTLLMYPYGALKGNLWIKKFSKFYYFVLLPLIVILFIAIGMRVGDYGVTVNRYAIILMGIWLTIVCFYFSIGKTNIKFVPVSLALLLMLITFGPWGMFSVSERSQVNRLINILEKNSMLTEGKVTNELIWETEPVLMLSSQDINELLLDNSKCSEIKSILDYLNSHHGFSSIKNLFTQNLDSLIEASGDKHINEVEVYMNTLGLEYKHYYRPFDYHAYSTENGNVLSVKGYDYFDEFYFYSDDDSKIGHGEVDNTTLYRLKYIPENNHELIFTSEGDSIAFELDSFFKKLRNKYGNNYEYSLPVTEMRVEKSSPAFDIKIEFSSIYFEEIEDSVSIESIRGDLFFTKKIPSV